MMVFATSERGTKHLQVYREKNKVVLSLAFINKKEGYVDDTTIPPKDAIEIGMQLIRVAKEIDPGLLGRMAKKGGKTS